MCRPSPLRSGWLPFSPTARLQEVTELVFLGLQVTLVVRIRLDSYRHPLDHLEAKAFEAIDLLGIVREQTDLSNPKVVKDLAADAVIALVGGMAQRLVGLDRVQSPILQVVGMELVQEPDTSPFLVPDVENYAHAVGSDHLHRRVQLRATVTSKAAEDVARQTFRVRAQENGPLWIDVAQHQREVILVAEDVFIGVKLPQAGGLDSDRDDGFDPSFDELFVPAAVRDHLLDRDQLDAMIRGECLEIGHACHRSVGLHDLGDHPRRIESGEYRKVHRRLSLAGTSEHASVRCPKRKCMSGHGEVAGLRSEEHTSELQSR